MTPTCKLRTGTIVAALERALLEPLGRLRGFGRVVIAGNVSPGYARLPERQMGRKEVGVRDVVDAAYEREDEARGLGGGW